MHSACGGGHARPSGRASKLDRSVSTTGVSPGRSHRRGSSFPFGARAPGRSCQARLPAMRKASSASSPRDGRARADRPCGSRRRGAARRRTAQRGRSKVRRAVWGCLTARVTAGRALRYAGGSARGLRHRHRRHCLNMSAVMGHWADDVRARGARQAAPMPRLRLSIKAGTRPPGHARAAFRAPACGSAAHRASRSLSVQFSPVRRRSFLSWAGRARPGRGPVVQDAPAPTTGVVSGSCSRTAASGSPASRSRTRSAPRPRSRPRRSRRRGRAW